MSFIGTDCCIFCNEPKHVLIHKRMSKNAFPDDGQVYINDIPCEACQEKMKLGFTFIERDTDLNQNTGKLWVLKMEAAERIIPKEFLETCTENIAYIDPKTAKEIGLYQEFDEEE